MIGWSKYKKYYYGVRYAVDSNPEELWKTYFTSSDYVKDFVKNNGDPDIVQIRKTFDDSQKAREWEWKVLRKMKVVYKEEWINKCDQISIPSMRGDSNPMKRQDVKNKHLEKMQSREYREKNECDKKGKKT